MRVAVQTDHAWLLVGRTAPRWVPRPAEMFWPLAAAGRVVTALVAKVDHARLLVGGAPIRSAPRLAEVGQLAAAIWVVTALAV